MKKSFVLCNLFCFLFLMGTYVTVWADNCPTCPTCPSCEPVTDPEAWVKSLAFGYNLTDGNSKTQALNIRAKANQEKDKNIWIFDIEQGWGETRNSDSGVDETNIDFTKGLAHYKRLLSERLYTGPGIDGVRDDIADIKYRVTPSLVLGYFLVKSDDLSFAIEAGPAYVVEEVGDIEDDYWAGKIADRFNWKLSETATFFQTAEALVSADDSDNYIINAEIGVTAPLTGLLSLVLSVKDSYDNQPAEDKERNDVSVVSALSVNF